jgi:hypothetical protein
MVGASWLHLLGVENWARLTESIFSSATTLEAILEFGFGVEYLA